MTCPHCGKTLFNNLQGFVNHVRISHNRYFPSHAEAVISCGQKLSDATVESTAYLAEDDMNDGRFETNTRKLMALSKQQKKLLKGHFKSSDRGSSPGYTKLRKRKVDGTEVKYLSTRISIV